MLKRALKEVILGMNHRKDDDAYSQDRIGAGQENELRLPVDENSRRS
jgi:hypothetical protein